MNLYDFSAATDLLICEIAKKHIVSSSLKGITARQKTKLLEELKKADSIWINPIDKTQKAYHGW